MLNLGYVDQPRLSLQVPRRIYAPVQHADDGNAVGRDLGADDVPLDGPVPVTGPDVIAS
jgi:hypothetical protein